MSDTSGTEWLKSILLDIVVTLVILSTVIFQVQWLRIIVLVYSGLILVVRVVVYFNESTLRTLYNRMEQMPSWPIHMLYAANVIFAVTGGLFFIAAMWGGIWIFSFLSEKKGRKYHKAK